MIRTRLLILLSGVVLSLVGCSKAELLNFTIPHDGYTVLTDIPYGDDDRQKLDIYKPDHPAAGHPVIMFFYGGSWQTGNKSEYLFVGQAFASKGYLTVIADYRVYPKVFFPTFITDSALATVWTHQHIAAYGGNTDNFFLGGHSAGAYNAVMLGVNSSYLTLAGGHRSWIKGIFALSGPYDFLPFTDPKIVALFSTAKDKDTQPINYVTPGLPPMLLLTGDKDTEVLPRNSMNMSAQLRAQGDPVDVIIYPGFDHIDIILALANGFRDKGPVLHDIDNFISDHLSDVETLPK